MMPELINVEFEYEVIETITHRCIIKRTLPDNFDERDQDDKCWSDLEQMIENGTWRETIDETETSDVEIFQFAGCTEVLD